MNEWIVPFYSWLAQQANAASIVADLDVAADVWTQMQGGYLVSAEVRQQALAAAQRVQVVAVSAGFVEVAQLMASCAAWFAQF